MVAIVIDQFRYDYLTRFRSEYTGGFKRLLIKARISPTRAIAIIQPLPPSATPHS